MKSKSGKKGTKRRKLNFKNIFIILIIIGIGYFGFYYYDNLTIQTIKIIGTKDIKDSDVIRIAGIKDYPEIFTLDNEKVINQIKGIDLVNSVKIDKSLSGTLTITIDECDELFYYLNTNVVILSNNKQIETSLIGLPTIINYVPDDYLKSLVKCFKNIDLDIVYSINEIEYSPSKSDSGEVIDNTRFILKMNDGNTVYMNTVNFDKLSSYFKIFDAIENESPGLRGTLKLDSATDSYSFISYDSLESSEDSES